ncbi:MAG: ABC transporter ATP-binding protein [Isosphaeraceae bacterium]
MIEVLNFTKCYGDFVAVDDLSFSIGQGEVFGFIGPNGAGKSTTIRFLATLLRPTSGEGRVAGFSVVTQPMEVRRVIGFMPDDFGVYDGMKVWEFLDFFAVAYEIPVVYRKKIINEVLELLELSHKRDDYVNGLSKGMKQRLCLAKTLVHDPPVLILDEPASGLDPRARLEMKAAPERASRDGQDDPRVQPHPLGAGRLLHLDRHHRAGQAARGRQHPGYPAAARDASRPEGQGARPQHRPR